VTKTTLCHESTIFLSSASPSVLVYVLRGLRVILPALALSVPIGAAHADRTETRTAITDEALAETEHVCSACHGTEGQSVSPLFPHLAGQQKEYLTNQLKGFRDHSRADRPAHTYMWGMAAHLSNEAIDQLAGWYAALPPVTGKPEAVPEIEAGKKIFTEGVAATNVPACGTCHGESAEGMGEIPRLAGQHRSYLETQLTAFASRDRDNPIMHETAEGLTPEQIASVAAYLAAR